MRTALLLVDIQNDYFPGGKNELKGAEEASQNAKELLKKFRNSDLPIIHIKHISTRPGATFFLPNTTGCEFHVNVEPIVGERILIKNYPNSFRNTGLNEILHAQAIERLVICGMMTHMCIDTSVRAAYDLGYECILCGDACATKDLINGNELLSAELVHKSFLSAMNGMFCKVVNTKDLMKEVI